MPKITLSHKVFGIERTVSLTVRYTIYGKDVKKTGLKCSVIKISFKA